MYATLLSDALTLRFSLNLTLLFEVVVFLSTIWISYDSLYIVASSSTGDIIGIALIIFFDMFFILLFASVLIIITVVLYVLADDGAEAYPEGLTMNGVDNV